MPEFALTNDAARALGRLTEARVLAKPCAPIRDMFAAEDIDTAYAIQSAWIDQQVAAGAVIAGHKIGLTNPVVQLQLGVDQPDFGVLLDWMSCREDEPIDVTRTLQPRIEAEIAFVLGHDLDSPWINHAAVAAATDYVVAALEIVDSRIANWDIGIVDTVADNASSGLYVLGAQRHSLDGLDLTACTMTMSRDGQEVSTGTGAACLGDPLAAVAWLARTTRAYGLPLRAGDVILSGALGPMVTVRPGDTFHAQISGVGDVAASFTKGPR